MRYPGTSPRVENSLYVHDIIRVTNRITIEMRNFEGKIIPRRWGSALGFPDSHRSRIPACMETAALWVFRNQGPFDMVDEVGRVTILGEPFIIISI